MSNDAVGARASAPKTTQQVLIRPSIRAVKCGPRRTLLDYDDLLRAIGKDPESEGPDRPKTISIERAVELSTLSRTTLWRMRPREGRSAA
jgi:hypothetical protein